MITATAIKKFNAAHGCGITNAREALNLTNGDWELARRYLIEKGQAVVRRATCPVCAVNYRYDTFLDKICYLHE